MSTSTLPAIRNPWRSFSHVWRKSVLDYASATRLYEGRKYKHVGCKVRNRVYMKHDSERECFVLSELWSTCERVPDPDHPGEIKYQKAPKERWDMRPFAE